MICEVVYDGMGYLVVKDDSALVLMCALILIFEAPNQ